MTDFTISTNLIGWVVARANIFGWPIDGAEAEVIDRMEIGDALVPKFAQHPDFGTQAEYVKALCERLKLDYEAEHTAYEEVVKFGAGAVPFVWVVQSLPRLVDDFPNATPWRVVGIEQRRLEYPLSTSEFLRLRLLPVEIARQFKAMAAPGRHVQALPDNAAAAIESMGRTRSRGPKELRSLSLVKEPPLPILDGAGRFPEQGDFAFVVSEDRILGFHEAQMHGQLTPVGQRIELAPEELPDLIARAMARATKADRFYPGNATAAAAELADFIASDELFREVPEFGTFYDRYVLLPKKVSQALELAERDVPPRPVDEPEPPGEEEDEDDGEQAELDNLHGLTVSATANELPEGFSLPDSVLAEAVTAVRAGKHLLLSGPPGTGKSTVASAICRAVVRENFDVATATADWTTFETIGGYMPSEAGKLEFEPGLVLRALRSGRWLVIDEINRADIDKAFGPLFTLLADGGDSGSGTEVVLPYRNAERSIRIVRSARREGAGSPYAMTAVWRLIGTLNARDKATLFRLSFAFLRRFAIVDVPLPGRYQYRSIYEAWNGKLEAPAREATADAALALAFGARQLGPAILKDIAEFTSIGVAATDTASRSAPYDDPIVAFLTAVRLYAIPQYEGATRAECDELLQRLRRTWPDPPPDAWDALEQALSAVALS